LLLSQQLHGHSYTDNRIFYSELRQAYATGVLQNLGIKYVAEGTEYYKIGQTEYKVSEKQLLIAGACPGAQGFVDSATLVKGICIDFNPATVSDAFSCLAAKERIDPDLFVSDVPCAYSFFEHVAPAGSSTVAARLVRLETHLLNHNFSIPFVNEEWFLELLEDLICDQHEKWKCSNALKYTKLSTQKEVLRRLLIGKCYMDENFCANPDIKSIAQLSCLSQFTFFRSFRDAFGITPHQYMLRKKMELAVTLLTRENRSVMETALQLNFSDVHAFSNAFRKKFGYPPSAIAGK
jgi:AraC family transcriptional regulator